MKDLKPGEIFTDEYRRCVNCGSDVECGGMLRSGVHCRECMPRLGIHKQYRTRADWTLAFLNREHINPPEGYYHIGRDIIISTDARLKYFGTHEGEPFYYLAYE